MTQFPQTTLFHSAEHRANDNNSSITLALYIIHSPYILYVEEGAHIYDSLLSHLKLFLCGHRCRLTPPFFGLSDCRAVQTWMPTQPSGTGTPPTVQIPLNQNLSYLKLNNKGLSQLGKKILFFNKWLWAVVLFSTFSQNCQLITSDEQILGTLLRRHCQKCHFMLDCLRKCQKRFFFPHKTNCMTSLQKKAEYSCNRMGLLI